jgi:predicted TIM-barrel fold metal-dependent hydrolase
MQHSNDEGITMTDLAQYVQSTPLMDTHEHTIKEADYVNNGPDVQQDLFGLYIPDDLLTAGAPRHALFQVLEPHDPDIEQWWDNIKEAWQHSQFTGYGRAVRYAAKTVYGMDEINAETLQAAAERNVQLRQPGERLRLLKETANLDHIQIDHFVWACLPDPSGPDFFLYDISWESFCNGQIDFKALHDETQIDVTDLATLRQAMAGLFAKYGPCAIAVKAQHAYTRTLAWRERDDAEAEPVLQKMRRGEPLSKPERLCIGDWCCARGVELATEHRLPFKIHTGYLARTEVMVDPDRTRPSHLAPLLARYKDARFVLMHTAYPYSGELIALAKHFPCVYVDMCWGWGIDFRNAMDFVRRMIHTVPVNKLFVFGGDSFTPSASVAYAAQARDGLTRALQAEIDDGFLTEAEAIHIASRFMRDNQAACFDLDGTRAAIHARLSAGQ